MFRSLDLGITRVFRAHASSCWSPQLDLSLSSFNSNLHGSVSISPPLKHTIEGPLSGNGEADLHHGVGLHCLRGAWRFWRWKGGLARRQPQSFVRPRFALSGAGQPIRHPCAWLGRFRWASGEDQAFWYVSHRSGVHLRFRMVGVRWDKGDFGRDLLWVFADLLLNWGFDSQAGIWLSFFFFFGLSVMISICRFRDRKIWNRKL